MANVVEVKVPDIGDFKDVVVIEVMVKSGDAVNAEDSLITLETDKAAMDVPAPSAGAVKEVKVKVGDKVSQGSLILLLESGQIPPSPPLSKGGGGGILSKGGSEAKDVVQASSPEEAAPASPQMATQPTSTPVVPPLEKEPVLSLSKEGAGGISDAPPSEQPSTGTSPHPQSLSQGEREASSVPGGAQARMETGFALAHASPTVRQFARELGVDLGKVKGGGPKGRILREDVQAYVKTALAQPAMPAGGAGFAIAPMPQVDFAKFGPIEKAPLSRIRKLAGANLHRNWVSIPHVTQHDGADITELEEFRKSNQEGAGKQGIKLTMLAFLLKASAVALRQFPDFNSSLSADGGELIRKNYYHIGVAVDTPEGLVVPVIRDVDTKGAFQLAKELGEISARARDKKLNAAQMQGGTFSISSLGGIGGSAFTPIINAPEVAILGVSRAALKPVYRDGQLVPRLMLPISLSYDHRVVDGAAGARFTTFLCAALADMRKLIL